MRPLRPLFFGVITVTLVLLVGASTLHAQPAPVGVRTIFLDAGAHGFSVPSTVTYHPGFDRYYTSDTGNPSYPGFVFSNVGGLPIQTQTPLNIDARSWNYNSNTGLLEVVTYDAVSGGAGRGLIEAQIDGSGALTGGTSTLLASMPGNLGSQTAPAYNAAANVFYSRDNSNVVNVVNRSDGSLAGTINLDFATAGVVSVPADGIVFVPGSMWLGVLDQTLDSALFFDLAGNFVGATSLDIDITGQSRRPGFSNGQLFAFDSARNGWQGYSIGEQETGIPTMTQTGLIALILLLAAIGVAVLRLRA